MFFPRNFAPDVWLTFQALDIPVQEAVLDALEQVLANPQQLRYGSAMVAVHEAEVYLPLGRHTIFIELLRGNPGIPWLVSGLGVVKH